MSKDSEDCMKPIKVFLRRHSGLIYGLVFAASVLGIWATWAIFAAPWIAGTICTDAGKECAFVAQLGQVGDLFGGVNALFAAFAFIAVAVGTVQAANAYRLDRQLVHDEAIWKQIQATYEKAYSIFTSKGEPPPAHPAVWTPAARHILRAIAMEEKIQTDIYRFIVAEGQEYWRLLFRLVVDKLGPVPWEMDDSYFYHAQAMEDEEGEYEVVVPKVPTAAAMVLVSFAQQHSEEVNDPLELLDDDIRIKNWDKGIVGAALKSARNRVDENRKQNHLRMKAYAEDIGIE